MPIDYTGFAIPKFREGDSRAEARRQKRLSHQQDERTCREAVHRRDKGKCVIPGCKERSAHLHHILYRSKGGRWRTQNICSLCPSHHAMVHAGRIQISGDADVELFITGDTAALKFKL
jgi:hypothetical protein